MTDLKSNSQSGQILTETLLCLGLLLLIFKMYSNLYYRDHQEVLKQIRQYQVR